MLAAQRRASMPWQEQTAMSLREEFVTFASADGANLRALCRRFGVSPTTRYAGLARYRAEGGAGLGERSSRPHAQPHRTEAAVEARVVALRDANPAWGGRKLRHVLLSELGAAPAASTITEILRRHERLDEAE